MLQIPVLTKMRISSRLLKKVRVAFTITLVQTLRAASLLAKSWQWVPSNQYILAAHKMSCLRLFVNVQDPYKEKHVAKDIIIRRSIISNAEVNRILEG